MEKCNSSFVDSYGVQDEVVNAVGGTYPASAPVPHVQPSYGPVQPESRSGEVQSGRAHPLALAAALEAAGGDVSRLLINPDLTVTVLNRPRVNPR